MKGYKGGKLVLKCVYCYAIVNSNITCILSLKIKYLFMQSVRKYMLRLPVSAVDRHLQEATTKTT